MQRLKCACNPYTEAFVLLTYRIQTVGWTRLKTEIVDLCEENVDDALLVCTSPKLRDDEMLKLDWKLEKTGFQTFAENWVHVQKQPT